MSAFLYPKVAVNPLSVVQKIVNGIIVACCVFPMTIVFSIMFYKMPRKYMWIAYLLAGCFMSICGILTLIETLSMLDFFFIQFMNNFSFLYSNSFFRIWKREN